MEYTEYSPQAGKESSMHHLQGVAHLNESAKFDKPLKCGSFLGSFRPSQNKYGTNKFIAGWTLLDFWLMYLDSLK